MQHFVQAVQYLPEVQHGTKTFYRRRGALLAGGQAQAQRELEANGTAGTSYTAEVAIERKASGKPHKGKFLAAIQPHCDDIPIFAGGTVLKLLDEGYTGVLITMSNDSMAGDRRIDWRYRAEKRADTNEVARRRLGITGSDSS